MIGAWEDPNVAANPLQKLNLNKRAVAGDQVPCRDHEVAGRNGRQKLASKGIACSCRNHQVRGPIFCIGSFEAPVSVYPRNSCHTSLVKFHPRPNSTFEEHSIQNETRKDCDWMTQVKARASAGGTPEQAPLNYFLMGASSTEKRVLMQCFVG